MAALNIEVESEEFQPGVLSEFGSIPVLTKTTQNSLPFSNGLCSAIRPRKCLLCPKTFIYKEDLKRHNRVHTGEKTFKCAYCPKRSAHLHNLKVHSRTHTGEKPYPCDYCEKTFRSSSDRKKHVRIHTGEKPYPCEYCEKTFRNSSDRKKHVRIHTGEKPFCCAICGNRFTQSSTLKLHAATHGPKRRRAAFLFVDCGNTEEEPQSPTASEYEVVSASKENDKTKIKAI